MLLESAVDGIARAHKRQESQQRALLFPLCQLHCVHAQWDEAEVTELYAGKVSPTGCVPHEPPKSFNAAPAFDASIRSLLLLLLQEFLKNPSDLRVKATGEQPLQV